MVTMFMRSIIWGEKPEKFQILDHLMGKVFLRLGGHTTLQTTVQPGPRAVMNMILSHFDTKHDPTKFKSLPTPTSFKVI